MIAVTGASGHIGANLVRALLERGEKVRVLVRKDVRAIEGLDVERVEGDVLDVPSLDNLIAGADCVYHLAARITLVPDRDGSVQRINVEGPKNVAEACMRHRIPRLVHFSSIHAFSEFPRDGVVDETRPLTDDSNIFVYDRSKAAGERAIQEAVKRGLNAVIVNPTAVIGPYDFKPSALGSALLDLYEGRMPALVKGGFDWVDVRDICAGAMAAAEKGGVGEKYLLTGHHLPFPQLARIVEAETGLKMPRLSLPMWMAYMGVPFAAFASRITGKPPKFTRASLHALWNHQQISHAKATRELGYSPRPINETIRDTYAWFEKNGYARRKTR
ncbi:MAG: SDR family oxidoreductase [Candidatus Hydrogenedentes bacterium]|nr:SDR family oxidoreductase [Candidatus Hydrogenedentota bacterium]